MDEIFLAVVVSGILVLIAASIRHGKGEDRGPGATLHVLSAKRSP